MTVKCDYCGSMIDDTLVTCPKCGSPNKNVVRSTSDQPKTIEEFKAWYKSKGLPPYEITRFFIGEDYKDPRAFGIFKNETTDVVTVYMNTNSGNRRIHYEGTDELYAVNMLFWRLKQEIMEQKAQALK